MLHDGRVNPGEEVVLQNNGPDGVAVVDHVVAGDDTWRREADGADAVLVLGLNAHLRADKTNGLQKTNVCVQDKRVT